MQWLVFSALIFVPLPMVVYSMRFKSQAALDAQRKTYLLTFPNDLAEDRVQAWLRSIAGVLKRGGISAGVPTIVFETWASSSGIVHRMHVPNNEADYIANQLRSLIPGLTVADDENRPKLPWNYVMEVGMTRPSRRLRIANNKDMSASLLASVQALDTDETIVTQWILSPASHEPLPSKEEAVISHDFSVVKQLTGSQLAHNDEIEDRRQKLSEHNVLAIGRVAAVAKDENRARHLAYRVTKALAGAHSHANQFQSKGAKRNKATAQVNDAHSPLLFPAQFAISELAGVLSWPIGQPFVAGLPRGASRQLYASDQVGREGILIGNSNYPGHERQIAIDPFSLMKHLYLGGKPGMGKSTLLSGIVHQALRDKMGAFVVDVSNSDSKESIFSRVLDLIPDDRVDDVIVIDISHDRENPIGFNLLDQGNPRVATDQIAELFAHLYQDTRGVWARRLLFHGLYTLAEFPGHSFVDIIKLLAPSDAEQPWSQDLIRNVKDPELKEFWNEWHGLKDEQRRAALQPLMNRAWQLLSRPETRNIIGQSKSSFQWKDAILENKIVLISLRGIPQEEASLLGALFINSLWSATQSVTPERPNLLVLDEFQLLERIPIKLDSMLREARKHKMPMLLATQYMEMMPTELQAAVTNATGSQVIFRSSQREARHWRSEFGGGNLTDDDFMHSNVHEAIAQIATPTDVSAPFTMKAISPFGSTKNASRVRALSLAKYSRPASEVRAEISARRQPKEGTGKRLPVGTNEWEPDK